MAKKQKSFADKAAGNTSGDSVYVKYVKSVQSEQTGRWRFNEQMIRMNKGEQLDAALKRMDEVANLVDIDLSEFMESKESGEGAPAEEKLEQNDVEAVQNSDEHPGGQIEEKQEPKGAQEVDSKVEENLEQKDVEAVQSSDEQPGGQTEEKQEPTDTQEVDSEAEEKE